MDIRQLGYFVRVAELGSFSRASAFLHVAQPALSRQVRNLEIELKERLLVRNGRGVEVTEAGERLLSNARGILRMVERTYEDIDNARTGKSGKVAIGLPATISIAIATALIRRLREELSDAQVTLIHGRSSQLQEWLLSGRIDMAIMYNAPSSPMLEIHDLVDENLYLIGSEDAFDDPDPVPLEALASLPMVIACRPNSTRVIVESELARMGQKPNIVFELDPLETMFDLVRDGYGFTVASMRTLKSKGAGSGLATRKIVGPELVLSVELVQPARRLNNRLHEAAFRILRDLSLQLLKDAQA
ncbi:LysR substrate-binding domain-containing protein [Neorhizobium sp. CSC1952]|uniref:HTH-type transcriptional regulator TtuA n=1 Tax=Xaviernesmea oryzae TaxID=464029 RepID=A0A1X7GPA2_9HYPH|nr:MULTISPECIES: LysR substrate-binding domain-containing protein [Rhizobium/Agrobacterium group]WJR66131.1 LysR substrate-binding domain-containing protein [Rhizobium sp. CSC1952]SMF72711.1 LysR family transcriptional regulator, nitrogen assimilation regulatory protein [Xaviernesmea oryzae]